MSQWDGQKIACVTQLRHMLVHGSLLRRPVKMRSNDNTVSFWSARQFETLMAQDNQSS